MILEPKRPTVDYLIRNKIVSHTIISMSCLRFSNRLHRFNFDSAKSRGQMKRSINSNSYKYEDAGGDTTMGQNRPPE